MNLANHPSTEPDCEESFAYEHKHFTIVFTVTFDCEIKANVCLHTEIRLISLPTRTKTSFTHLKSDGLKTKKKGFLIKISQICYCRHVIAKLVLFCI